MARRTRDQIRDDNRVKTVAEYIQKNKFLRESKYYKNNYWSWAAWDSWAAQGKAGCYCGICSNSYYNATLKNKRAKTEKGTYNKPQKWSVDVSRNACVDCVRAIESQLKVEFKRV